MSIDLSDLLAPVVDGVDRSAPTITLDEITSRRGAVSMIDRSPDATSITLDQQPRRRGWAGPLVGAAAAVVVVGALIAVSTRGEAPNATVPLDTTQPTTGSPATSQPTSSDVPSSTATSTAPVTVVPAEVVSVPFTGGTTVTPTLLEPLALPAGFQLLQGGTVPTGGSPHVDLWTPDLEHWYSIGWSPGFHCEQTTITDPWGPLASGVEEAIAQLQPPGDVDGFTWRQLRWCEGDVLVSVDGVRASDDELAALARTVSTSSSGDGGAFIVPTGFTYRIGLLNAEHKALVYSNGEATLRVLSFASSEGEFEVLQRGMSDTVDLAVHPIEPFEINGRQAFWRFDTQLVVQYDSQTMAYIDGVGVTDQELLDVAASLVPADPSLAPPLTGSCDVLSICG